MIPDQQHCRHCQQIPSCCDVQGVLVVSTRIGTGMWKCSEATLGQSGNGRLAVSETCPQDVFQPRYFETKASHVWGIMGPGGVDILPAPILLIRQCHEEKVAPLSSAASPNLPLATRNRLDQLRASHFFGSSTFSSSQSTLPPTRRRTRSLQV